MVTAGEPHKTVVATGTNRSRTSSVENVHDGQTILPSFKQATIAFPVLWERSPNKPVVDGHRLFTLVQYQE